MATSAEAAWHTCRSERAKVDASWLRAVPGGSPAALQIVAMWQSVLQSPTPRSTRTAQILFCTSATDSEAGLQLRVMGHEFANNTFAGNVFSRSFGERDVVLLP